MPYQKKASNVAMDTASGSGWAAVNHGKEVHVVTAGKQEQARGFLFSTDRRRK